MIAKNSKATRVEPQFLLCEETARAFRNRFEGVVAFITGGASGLGLGQARLLGAHGCRVAIADVRQEPLDTAVAQLSSEGVDAFAVQLDVRDRNAYAEAARLVLGHFDEHPRLLFNTAGVNGFGPLHEATYADFDWVMGVNLHGVINGIQTLLPGMLEQDEPAHIVTTGSMAGFMGNTTAGIYAATKAAVFNLMESYNLTLKPHGIGASIVCPASIRTNISEALDARPEDLGENSSFRDDAEFRELPRQLYSTGMDPLQLAGHVVEGIVQDRLHILPFTETKDGVRAHYDQILAAFDEYGPPDEEALKRAAEFSAYR